MRVVIKLILIVFLFSKTSVAQNPEVVTLLSEINIDSLERSVKELSGALPVFIHGIPDTIHSRHQDSYDNEKAFQYIRQKIESYGLVADTQQYSVSGKNVYYKQAGTLFPHTHYILGAHYDNMPPFPFYTVAPGADDNASGSAAVIEAARIFSQHIFPYSIVFALWDEEEQGMIGSTAWLSGFDTGSDTILAYINLDMLGYDGNDDSLAMIYTKPVAQSVQLANISMQCNLDYTIGLGNIVLLNPAPNSSDQATFWNSNYSAIDITEDHLNDFNPAYHTPFDTIGLLNLLYYEKVTKLAFATLATLAIDTNRILGIENISGEADPQFIVSPNPTSGEFELLPKISGSNILDISVYNSMGEKIVTASEKQGRLIFDLSPFPTGIYFLKAQNPKVRFSKKIILEH